MNRNEIIAKLQKIRNGAYTNITFISELTPNKEHKGHVIQKIVSAVVRIGVEYSHIDLPKIQQRILSGTSAGALPWGKWDEEHPQLINHKDDTYLRCTVSRSPKHHRRVAYFIDGKLVNYEDAVAYTRPSEWNKPDDVVYNPKVSHILSLGKEGK